MQRWHHLWLILQGVPKKITTLRFVSYLRNQWTDLQTVCFCWTLRSIRIFWIQNHFCAITGAWDIRKTKRVFLINENVIDYWNLLSNAEVYQKIDNINFNWKLCVHFRQLKASQGLERPVRVSHEPVKAVRGHYRTVRDNPN